MTTTTISDAQYRYASKRIAEAGLADRVTVLDLDYRDLVGQFDKLVSVEMIEAVDWRDHDRFFATCAERLRPGGRMALQAIVIGDDGFDRARYVDDFIRTDVFPGGCLPSIGSIARSSARAGLLLRRLDDIGGHYGETLRRWRANLDAHAPVIEANGFDREFVRRWRFYLAYCEAGFDERYVSDVHVLFTPSTS